MEVNVTSPEPSDSESAAEDNADREEDEMRGETRVKIGEEMQGEGAAQLESNSPSCRRLNPASGKYDRCIMSTVLFLFYPVIIDIFTELVLNSNTQFT